MIKARYLNNYNGVGPLIITLVLGGTFVSPIDRSFVRLNMSEPPAGWGCGGVPSRSHAGLTKPAPF